MNAQSIRKSVGDGNGQNTADNSDFRMSAGVKPYNQTKGGNDS